MPGLLDIAPTTETVKIRGVEITVHGISAKGIAHLLAKYPEIRKLLSGRTVENDDLIGLGADIVSAIIAAGVGHPGETDYEEAAATLNISEQADILERVIALTMPQGVNPFMDRLMGLMGKVGLQAEASPKVPATK